MVRLAVKDEEIQIIPPYDMASYDVTLAEVLKQQRLQRAKSFAERFDMISGYFLGRPYVLGACGEGQQARFDKSPLYRADAFDCVSYVNTVIALMRSMTLTEFQKEYVDLNYQNHKVSYLTRNHFVSADWNPHNLARGVLNEFVMMLDDKPMPTVEASALVDRPEWLRNRSFADIKYLQVLTLANQQKLLQELHQAAVTLQAIRSQLNYMPLTTLFDESGQPNQAAFAQIPAAAVIEIVRPDWQMREKIGTNLNVSHMGFAAWKEGEIFLRHASQIHKKVCDEPLTDYLYQRLHSPTVKGISILKFNEDGCRQLFPVTDK